MSDNTTPAFLDTTSPVRYQASRRVALVGMLTNALLVVGQVAVGIIGHSQALVADGMHTLADLSSDLLVLYALKHSAKEADEEHPYGHARIETAVTLVLGVLLLLVGAGIAARAGLRLAGDAPFEAPAALTLWVSGFTILAKEGLYQYTVRTARRFDSDMLKASAWHHRSDAISSIIVFLGIAGSIAGIEWLDAAAALGVALFVAKIGIQLGWPAISELVDTGLDKEQVQHIRRTILGVDGVRALHLLRTRRIGGRALVDVHIIVDEDISVSEGHYISEMVRARLVNEVDVVADALVHIDPEDDTQLVAARDLPARSAVHAQLMARFKDIDAAARIERITLHYVGGRLRIELLLPLSVLASPDAGPRLAARFQAAVAQDPLIETLDVRFH
ncbi:MAG TPA: cation diffusion facilitator family transporter [Acidiferrobacterales bacterium]|nr:cation diffusion facilitator family transporter [Acidiferrobacterales bacterium]